MSESRSLLLKKKHYINEGVWVWEHLYSGVTYLPLITKNPKYPSYCMFPKQNKKSKTNTSVPSYQCSPECYLKVNQFFLRYVIMDGLHPVWHDTVPKLWRDHLIWHQAEQSVETFLNMICSGG